VRLIGDILVSGRAMTNDQLEKALEHKARVKGHLGTAILEVTSVSEQLVLRALSLQHKLPPVGAHELDDIRPDILRLIPVKLAARHQVIPFRRLGRVLSVAMVNPADLPAVDEISFLTGLQIAPHVALEFRLVMALGKHYGIEVNPRFLALSDKLDKSRLAPREGTPHRPVGTQSGAYAPSGSAAASVSGTVRPSGGLPPPPRFYRTGAERLDAPPGDTGDPWGVDVPPPSDTPIVTETFGRSEGGHLRAGPSAATATPGASQIYEPSPMPQQAPSAQMRAAEPPPMPPTVQLPQRAPTATAPQTGGISRFSAKVSGSWLDQEETPSPSEAPEIITQTTPAPRPRTPSAPVPVPGPAPPAVASAAPPAPAMPPSPPAAAPPPSPQPPAHPRAPSVPAASADSGAPESEPSEAEIDLAGRLANAESRDEIADAVLASTAGLVKRAALFIAQAAGVLGWAARPDPTEQFRGFTLPYSDPSLFASLRNTEGFYVGPCPDLPGNKRMLAAFGSSGNPIVALVPITLRGKSVLFLLGEAEAGAPPPPVPALKRIAAMTAIALEIVLLKNKLRNL
jgi:hypothetical protein